MRTNNEKELVSGILATRTCPAGRTLLPPAIDGLLAIDKPRGISSSFVVGKIKKALRQNGCKSKIGHMGTLDVDANGVLVIGIGKATKLFDEFLKKDKTYQSTFKFGIQTDTDDTTGTVIKNDGIIPTIEQIKKASAKIKEQTEQLPPQFCANSVNGVRAYELARQGKSVELKPKKIKIHDFFLVGQASTDEFMFEMTVGSGTYVRSICRDLAAFMGTYGVTSSITRTRCGRFFQKDCLNFDEISFATIIANLQKAEI